MRLSRLIAIEQRRGRIARTCAMLVGLLVAATGVAVEPAKPPNMASFSKVINPLLQTYCYDCHNDRKAKGDVNLKHDDNPGLIASNRKVWETALHVLQAKEMPPEKSKQPTDQERETLTRYLTGVLGALDCTTIKDPGRPAVRRLNRQEYEASMRSLFGVDLDMTVGFSPDATGYGFDTISDALMLSPVQMEQYYTAAERMLDVVYRDSKAMARVFTARPGPGDDERGIARRLITAFATRAYRKPVTPDHVDALLAVFDLARKGRKPFPVAVRPMLQSVLMSPRFLMRVEEGMPNTMAAYPVASYDMASRLSFFLWSAPPDEELLTAAANGGLDDVSGIEAQARRMLRDPRGRALAEHFAGQWLQVRSLAEHPVDRKAFPQYTDSLRAAMQEEAYCFIDDVFRNDRPITDLLAANDTFINEELARHYGITDPAVKGGQMRRMVLSDQQRGGIITMGAVLTLTADPGRTNIPRRGNYILGILGTPPPPPPADVPSLEAEQAASGKTVRQLLEMHRANPDCAGCHARIDPLGFGLEHFNAIGQRIEQQDGLPVDATGIMPSGERFTGAAEMKKILLARKAGFARAMSESLLIYALGRGLQRDDDCVVQDALKALEKNNYRFTALLTTVVRSFPFTHRRNADW